MPDDRCVTCVIPRAVRTLSFSEKGVCRLCSEAATADAPGARGVQPDIDQVVEQIRARKGKRYDCLVGLSGGRDSSYLVHELVRVHGLRVLAAYYRTPFTDDTIDGNVRRLTARLGVDLVEMHISQRKHRRVARDFVTLWLAHPLPELANLACSECKLVNREVFRIARRNGIPAIVFGGTPYESAQVVPTCSDSHGGSDGHVESLGYQTRNLVSLARRGLAVLLRSPRVVRNLPVAFKATFLYLNPHSTWLRLRYPKILRVDYFLHSPYDEAECERVIHDELGWQLPPGCATSWRADCSYADLKNLMFHRTTGATYLDCMLSNMVRAGVLSRQEALNRVDGRPPAPPERLSAALRVLGLPDDTFAATPSQRTEG